MIPPTTDFSLYFVTDTALCGGVDRVPHVVYEAVMGGVGVVQVRDKELGDAEFSTLAKECAKAIGRAEQDSGRPAHLFVNDRLNIAADLGLNVHVGQSDAAAKEARRVLGRELMVGLSVTSPDEARAAVAERYADVLGIGPVWSTPTKNDAGPPLGPDGVTACAAFARTVGLSSVAIGGINPSTATRLAGVPVDGLCVVSAIAGADDPRHAAAEMRRLATMTLMRGRDS